MLYNLIPSKHYITLEVVLELVFWKFIFFFRVSSYMFRCSNLYATNRKTRSRQKYLDNMFFVKGYVEELLFLDNSYDIVFSCIVFHHCTNVQNIFCIF